MPAVTANGACLITGASKRIGREIAIALSVSSHVVIHYNNSKDEAEELASNLRDKQLSVSTIKADLNNEAHVESLISKASEQAQLPISTLINNASLFAEDTPLTVSKSSFDQHMNINLWAPLKLSQELAKALPKGVDGHIINIIDQRVLKASTGFTSYTLSKAALWSLTQSLAIELAPSIQVNAIAPGPILKSIHQSNQDFADEVASLPLGKNASPEDIAKTVLFLLDHNSITGEMITLDGGQRLI